MPKGGFRKRLNYENIGFTDIGVAGLSRNFDEKSSIYTFLIRMSLNMSVTLSKLILDHL